MKKIIAYIVLPMILTLNATCTEPKTVGKAATESKNMTNRNWQGWVFAGITVAAVIGALIAIAIHEGHHTHSH